MSFEALERVWKTQGLKYAKNFSLLIQEVNYVHVLSFYFRNKYLILELYGKRTLL